MVYNIGDRVLVEDLGEAFITDRMYSEKNDRYFYSVRFKGDNAESDDLYEEDMLQPFVEEKVEYEIHTEICDGVAIFTVIEIRGDKRTLAARGHGHMLRNDLLGIVQAASWAAKKALTDLNGGNTYIEKEN